MTRIETGPGWELRCGDCLDPVTGLASLADKSVDHVITDPPFASDIYQRCKKNPGRNAGVGRGGKRHNTYSVGLKEMTEGAIGTLDASMPAMVEIGRVVSRWALAFCDVESLHLVKSDLLRGGLRWMRTGVWTKPDPMPQFSGDRPAQGFEVCAIAHSTDKARWNGGGKPALWHHGVCKGIGRPDHPCPKPIELMVDLAEDFTDPGDLVCDPFAGSGTTGVACIRLGRRFIGWEKDPAYFEIACRRLRGDEAKPRKEQPGLFDSPTEAV